MRSERPGAQLLRPRVGFLGVGWIGQNRMAAILNSGAVEVAAIADPASEILADAGQLARGAERVTSLDEWLDLNLDGIGKGQT